MLACRLKRVGTTELRIRDDQSNSPVYSHRKTEKQEDSCKETGLSQGVRLSNDASATTPIVSISALFVFQTLLHDAVGHVHESTRHPTLRIRGLKKVLRVEV